MLIDNLKKVLASNFAFYLKAHFFHWNVEGPDFAQFHDFFGDLYEELFSPIDKWAEEIRALNSYTPGSFNRYLDLSVIDGQERVDLVPLDMIRELFADNTLMINLLTQTYNDAENEKQIGLANFIQDRIDAHNKHGWMLRSFLKG